MSKKISYTPYIITILLILSLLWGQTRDEEPLPIVKEQLSNLIPQTNITPEENAFVAMAGFNTLHSTDMITEGLQSIQKTIQKTQQTPFEYNIKYEVVQGQTISHPYQLPCDTNFTNTQCLDNISQQTHLIQQLMQEQKGLINNYLVLQQLSKFAHTLPNNIDSILPYGYISNISQLLTANAILEIKAGHMEKGLSFLVNDIKFYRNILNSNERDLIDTSFAISSLLQRYFVLERLLHNGTDLEPYLSKITPLLQPLSVQERSLVYPLENERKNHLTTHASLGHFYFYTHHNDIGGCYNDSCAFNRYFSRLIYKFNGTLNAIYKDWQPTIDFAKADYPLNDNFLEKLKTLQTIEQDRHTLKTYQLYERYGIFLFKNYTGEKQKNNIYYQQGYTSYFIKLYTLNQSIIKLNNTLQKIY